MIFLNGKVFNVSRRCVIAESPVFAKSFSDRLRGMIGRNFINFDCMIFDRCSAVHTCFMSIPIDALFVSRDFKILRIERNLKPWRFCVYSPGAEYILEMSSGSTAENACPGDLISFKI